MPKCSAEQLNAAVLALQTTDGVESVDLLAATRRVEVIVGPNYSRVPPRVLRALTDHDLGVESVTPQGDGQWLIVQAR